MVFAHFTHHRAAAQDRRRLAQRRGDGRRRRVLRGGHPLAAHRRQPRPAASPAHGYRPRRVARGPGPARQEHDGGASSTTTAPSARSTTRARFRRCFRGLRLSKLFGRDGIITFESNGAFVLVRGGAAAAARCSPASGTSAATRRCIATSSARSAQGARARDEPRAGHRGPAPDGPDLRAVSALARRRPGRAPCTATEHFDIIIIGTGAGGGTMAHALAATGARILVLERGDVVPQGGRELGPGRGLEATCATGPPNAGSTAGASSSSPTRTTASAATPSSGAACSTGCAARTSARCEHSTASRRPGRSTTRRWRPYYDRAERLYHVHGEVGVDPTEPPRGPFPHPPVPHAPRDGEAWSTACARRGCIRRRCRSA